MLMADRADQARRRRNRAVPSRPRTTASAARLYGVTAGAGDVGQRMPLSASCPTQVPLVSVVAPARQRNFASAESITQRSDSALVLTADATQKSAGGGGGAA